MESRIDYGTLDLHHIFGNLEAPNLTGKEISKEAKLDGNDAPGFALAYLGPQIWSNNGESENYKLEPINLDDLLDESLLNEGLGELSGILSDEPSKDTADTIPDNTKEAANICIQEVAPVNDFCTPDFSVANQPTSSLIVESPKKQEDGRGPESAQYQPNITDMMISTPLDETDTTNQLFDPRKRTFTDDELKPQPIIRKAKKVYVPTESKDARYWHKREKNNAAAKRSREARRIKENQIVMRTKYLENENDNLRSEVQDLRAELSRLMKVVEGYQERETK